jgi:hypothetical protein
MGNDVRSTRQEKGLFDLIRLDSRVAGAALLVAHAAAIAFLITLRRCGPPIFFQPRATLSEIALSHINLMNNDG